jgi:deoxyribose-phosphate aldolase
MKKTDIARYIDHTLLKAEANEGQIKTLCTQAMDHGFASVCVNPCYTSLAKENLENSPLYRHRLSPGSGFSPK